MNNNTFIYFNRLDFLRLFAVGLVICQHWFRSYLNKYDIGTIGVIIFFVLSGFLITRILLSNKEKVESGKKTLKISLFNFYIRRSLRIFPIYYLLIFALKIFNHAIVNESFWWFALYSNNIKTYLDQSWMGTLGPLWSLAVEEQFYLLWPSIILLINKIHLKKVLYSMLIIGPIMRIVSIFFAHNYFPNFNPLISVMVLMPCNIDAFAIGGILAAWLNNKKEYNGFFLLKPYSYLLAIILIPLLYQLNYLYLHEILFTTVFSILSFQIIKKLIEPRQFYLTDRIILFKPFKYLGKVSYGIYLYHGPFFFIIAVVFGAINKFINTDLSLNQINPLQGNWSSLINVLILICITSLSWFIIEKPINKLKRHFE